MKSNIAATILRWGLAFVFFYAAIASLLAPENWIGFLPEFMTALIPAKILLTAFSVYEILLAAILFWGKQVKWSSLLATLTLAGIVVADWNIMDIVFRDIGLVFAGLALFEMAREKDLKRQDNVPS